MKTVRDIVIDYLKENGYDGLYNPDVECGCFINDLVPCCERFDECMPGMKQKMMFEGEEIDGIGPEQKEGGNKNER